MGRIRGARSELNLLAFCSTVSTATGPLQDWRIRASVRNCTLIPDLAGRFPVSLYQRKGAVSTLRFGAALPQSSALPVVNAMRQRRDAAKPVPNEHPPGLRLDRNAQILTNQVNHDLLGGTGVDGGAFGRLHVVQRCGRPPFFGVSASHIAQYSKLVETSNDTAQIDNL